MILGLASHLILLLVSCFVGVLYAWSILNLGSKRQNPKAKRQFQIVDAISLTTLVGIGLGVVLVLKTWFAEIGISSTATNNSMRRDWIDWLVSGWTWLIPCCIAPVIWNASTRRLQQHGVVDSAKRLVFTLIVVPITLAFAIVVTGLAFLLLRDSGALRFVPMLNLSGILGLFCWPVLAKTTRWCMSSAFCEQADEFKQFK